MKINRRQAMRSVLFSAAGLSQWNSLAAFALGQEESPVTIDVRQTLFQPMEASTLVVLDQYFPKYRQFPSSQWLLPYTAVIKNGGKDPVKALKLRWVQNVGGVDTTLFSTGFFSQPSTAHNSAIGTGLNTILSSGEYAIVTPLFLRSETKYHRHGGAIPIDKMMMRQGEAPSFFASTSTSIAYRVRRDVKICRHTAIGGLSKLTSQFEAAVNYEREVAATLITSAGSPDGLADAVTQLLATIKPAHASLSSRVKFRYLESVQARVKNKKAGAAWDAVQEIALRPRMKLTERKRVHVYSPAS